ncbi:MAG: oligogalacturonate lyase family protein [Spirochaetia bacterium]
MGKGDRFSVEPYSYVDRISGRRVHRLTSYRGHSSHPYFTDPCWFNDGRSLLFTSDRNGESNLFRYDLDIARITQLTELSGRHRENERVFDYRPQAAWSEVNGRCYFWWCNVLYELNVDTCEQHAIYEAPGDTLLGIHAITSADGRYVCNAMRERVERDEPGLEYPYHKFPELLPSRPRTQILRIDVQTGDCETVFEDQRFITHVNLSPTLPEILTFCHEGQWDQVEQRIWGLNIRTGNTWKIRPQTDGEFSIGHEYWFSDGVHIGYHGRPRPGAGSDHVYGYVSWDNSERREVRFPFHSTHFASLDETIIVGDGTPRRVEADQPYIQLFRKDDDEYAGPKVLAEHQCTFNHQHSHCHPRFSPDGEQVLFVSDATGYAQMYMVEVGEFESLPALADV